MLRVSASPIHESSPSVSDGTRKTLIDSLDTVSPRENGNNEGVQEPDKLTLIQDQRQTIALLVSEKAALAGELERLSGVEARGHCIQPLFE